MKIVLASANKGKITEFQKLMPEDEVVAFNEILGEIEIEEDQDSFKGNAIKKAKTIYDLLVKKGFSNIIVISDDSGISVPVLNNAPGIYSARYAGINASDKDNNAKLISKLNELNLEKTPAFYTACIALIYKNEVYTVHGWMHGIVVNKEVGENGFGYDPIFIPNGFSNSFAQMSADEKNAISHRAKAVEKLNIFLTNLNEN